MVDLKVKTQTNIWLSKSYLKKFRKKYKTPDWVYFCDNVMDMGFEVFLYFPMMMSSVYISIVKNHRMQTIRFSNHVPSIQRWLSCEVDYLVGPDELGMLTCEEVMEAINVYFK